MIYLIDTFELILIINITYVYIGHLGPCKRSSKPPRTTNNNLRSNNLINRSPQSSTMDTQITLMPNMINNSTPSSSPDSTL